jgi:hypothetical protein
VKRRKPRNLATDAPLLCSDRQAAHLLGVARERVAELRRSGVLRTVRWFTTWRIPLAEIQRIARTGTTPAGKPSRRRVRAPAGNVAEQVLAIKLEDLQ